MYVRSTEHSPSLGFDVSRDIFTTIASSLSILEASLFIKFIIDLHKLSKAIWAPPDCF